MTNSSYTSLVAQFYDKFLEQNTDDIEFLKSYIQKDTKSILEIAVGTGRLLIPLLENGFNIDGLDNSKEMLDIARKKIGKLNLKNNLFNESMTNFKLNKQYDFIFIGCGSFMIVDYQDGINTLNCIKDHLVTNGELLLDLFIPWDDIQKITNSTMNIVRDVSINTERCLVYESFSIDVYKQNKYGKYKYEYYNNGVLKETELNELNIHWYFEDEIKNILYGLGFSKVNVLSNISSYIKNGSFLVSAIK